MPLLYSSHFSDVVGKILIDPLSRVVTLYIHEEDSQLNVFLRALRQHLTSTKNYLDIGKTNPLHTDQIHCCTPEPLLPSHAHFGFKEAITPDSLHRFFGDIAKFESNPKAIQASVKAVGDSLSYVDRIEISPRQPSSLLHRLFGKSHLEYIRRSDTQRIEQAYSLGLDELSANIAKVAVYSFCIALIPRLAEQGVKRVLKNREGSEQWAKGAKYITQAALLFYLIDSNKITTRLMAAIIPPLIEGLLNEHQLSIASTANTFLTATAMMCLFLNTTYSTTALNTLGTLAGSFVIGKVGIWLADRTANMFAGDNETKSAPSLKSD